MRRPTYSEVASTLALFIALGGTSYAVTSLPADSVGSAQLKSASVTASKLHTHAVGAAAVANDSLTGKQIDESSLGIVPRAASANSANTAGSATTATFATTAKSATNADTATTAATATTALSANDSAMLGGAPAASYLVSCPSGMLQTGGLCVEQALRPGATFLAAAEACGLVGRRLPSVGELLQAFNVLGAPQAKEWTSDFDSQFFVDELAEDIDRSIQISAEIYTDTPPYRCVSTASN